MRVAIADDAVLLREGVARLLTDAGFEVVAHVRRAPSRCSWIWRPGRWTSAFWTSRCRRRSPTKGCGRPPRSVRDGHGSGCWCCRSTSSSALRDSICLADGAEGLGYLLKDRVADVEEFVDAVRRVGEGGSALDPTVVSQMLSRRQADEDLGRLTPREHLVLEAMAQGLANRAIADRLHVSVRAVEKHVTNIFDKLGLVVGVQGDRRVLAVLRFLRR